MLANHHSDAHADAVLSHGVRVLGLKYQVKCSSCQSKCYETVRVHTPSVCICDFSVTNKWLEYISKIHISQRRRDQISVEIQYEQVCIPVGCEPPASVAVWGCAGCTTLSTHTPFVHTPSSTHPLPRCVLGYTHPSPGECRIQTSHCGQT